MIKGCQRRIIMVKDTNSKYFDSAYFVLRNDLEPSAKDSEMMSEARRMIGSYAPHRGAAAYPSARQRKRRISAALAILLSVGMFLAGAALVALIL